MSTPEEMDKWLEKCLETYRVQKGVANLVAVLTEYAKEKEFATLLNSCNHSFVEDEYQIATRLIINEGWNDFLDTMTSRASFSKLDMQRMCFELSCYLNKCRNSGIGWGGSRPPDLKELHPTEQKYPEQAKRFREILDEMYQVHLKKNADYSPYNILVTGMRGCVTRLWDKSARFFSLMGLDILKFEWTEERANRVEDEDVNQTLIDWANYCIITRILREGLWGK